jgi:RNA polymerase sigma-70 factor (sigma-E family)
VNTVVDGQSAKAVFNGRAPDPVLAADPVLEAQVEVLPTQEVTVVAPEVTNSHDVGHGASPLLDGHALTNGLASAAEMSVRRTEVDGAATYMMGDGEPSAPVARPTIVAETLTASALVPEIRSAPSVWDADRVVTEIYHGEYKSLVRLAVLLVHDVPTAEEVVQDAFEAMHTAWRRLRDSDKALSYLRQAVVNKSRSVLRHRTVVDKNAPKPAPDEPSAEQGALALIERSAVVAALRTLPDRQREAIVLRYYADLSEADIAATMGISKGAVKSHTARAMAALKSILEQETS